MKAGQEHCEEGGELEFNIYMFVKEDDESKVRAKR